MPTCANGRKPASTINMRILSQKGIEMQQTDPGLYVSEGSLGISSHGGSFETCKQSLRRTTLSYNLFLKLLPPPTT